MSSVAARLPLARLAFRPFFLLAAAFSVVALLVWLAFWHGIFVLSPRAGMLWWHQHEMLFGVVGAVVSGFLLTAVQTWTGLRGLHGAPLLGLVALWLGARLGLAFPVLPQALVMALDVGFLLIVCAVMAVMVIRAKRWRNLIFVPVLAILAGANLGSHLGVLQGDPELVRQSSYLAVLLVTLIMGVLGGRVIPMFTANRLGLKRRPALPWLEGLALGSLALAVVLQLARTLGGGLPDSVLALALLVAALAHPLRLIRWQGRATGREPLLWSLHLSYAFVPLGLLLWALGLWGVGRAELGVHAITVGAMGTMMLSMMSRVSLGHTGRPMCCLPGIGVALGLLVAAGLSRSLVLALWPSVTHWVYSLSILLWCLGYAIFLAHYVPILGSPRVDGQDG
ncbi:MULTISPECIES: NnrS family protein [unclassified Halomonas]|uniref:NnrS family protein n=1 Tax=unclassified Halomonas TaxID=2609666 RepID=UPI000C934354|nr:MULTISPECIES: NnrS family protein [unclassified Halomonas]MAR73601.1 NnrS [Halomonas sp.]|tara:strand:+ start:624 stop:1808 length:1185 start_codon:yes stop_codon:yes gene_type:complete